jgi:hypothetical protein
MSRHPRVTADGLLTGAAAGIALLLAWWGTRWGAGTSPDSNRYLSAAVSLAESWRIDSFTGTPLTQFPPGYPVVVRLAMLPGLSWQTASRVICILAAGGIVLAAAAVSRRVVRSPVLRAAVIAIAVVAPALTTINRMAWTEPLFIIAMLALAAVLIDIDRSNTAPTRRALLTLTALTSAAFLLRYAGLGLVLGVAISLALIGHRRHRWLGGVVSYVATSAIVPALWFARNLVVAGDIGGPPLPPRGSLWSDLGLVLETFGRGLLPTLSPSDTTSTVFGALGAGMIVAVSSAAARQSQTREIMILASLSGFLLLQLVLTARTTWVAIGNRMLSPLLIPAVLIVAIALDRWMQRGTVADRIHDPTGEPGNEPAVARAGHARHRRVVGGVAGALAILLLAGWTVKSLRDTATAHDTGVGTAGAFWRKPRLADDLATIPPDAAVVSNEAGAVWNISGRFPVFALFDRERSLTEQDVCAGAYMVWFKLEPDRPNWVPADATPLIERRWWSVNLLSTAGCEDDVG